MSVTSLLSRLFLQKDVSFFQIIGHVSFQCRCVKPNCKFYAERYRTDQCSNPAKANRCFNCMDNHKPSSETWPIYRYEFEVMKTGYLINFTRVEAIQYFKDQGVFRQSIESYESLDKPLPPFRPQASSSMSHLSINPWITLERAFLILKY